MNEPSRLHLSRLILAPLCVGALASACAAPAPRAISAAAAPSAVRRYEWQSPHGWRGGTFSIPPAFAADVEFQGREVLRFSPGFYDPDAPGFWNYVFVFLLPRDADVSDANVRAQLIAYFHGLGQNLGPHADPALDRATIRASAVGEGLARVSAYDPWQGQPVELNVRWSSRPCDGGERRALLFELSRAPLGQGGWSVLRTEVQALRCW